MLEDNASSTPVRPTPGCIDARINALLPRFDVPFFLAGLAGYSDGAMRMVARHYGCPYCITESLRADMLLRGGKGLSVADPDPWQKQLPKDRAPLTSVDRSMSGDQPLAAQIIGNDAEMMAQAAIAVSNFGYPVIDVNLACPPKRSKKRSCQGGMLLAEPTQAIDILRSVREALPATVITSVKLRRAYDDTPAMEHAFEQIFESAYELGYSWTTVHCRTVEQRYDGPGRWSFLTELMQRYDDRLVFGSGDIWKAEDIFAMLERTGVHAVAVARGGIGSPWIFRQAHQILRGQETTEPTLTEILDVLELHASYSVALQGEKTASRLMRKFGIKFAESHAAAAMLKESFVNVRSLTEWRQVIARARAEIC